jgi:periplasmic divalent cation tolerance protein
MARITLIPRRDFVMEFSVVLVTTGSQEEADRIATCLVEERLAACVNIVGGIRSVYRWEGKVQRDPELLLLVKIRSAELTRVQARVRELHSYETPEVIALPIAGGSEAYLRWLEDSTV